MINSRNLKDLHPKVEKLARLFIERCASEGVDVLITSTYRDSESQNALFAKGRTAPGRRVTNAKAGQSWHNFKLAFDFAPLVHGKIDWNDTALFEKCGKIGETVGLEWAGRWKSFKELAHLQYTGGHALSYFQNGGEL